MTIREVPFVEVVALALLGREWGAPDWRIADHLRRRTGDPWTAGQVTALLATDDAERVHYWNCSHPPLRADPLTERTRL